MHLYQSIFYIYIFIALIVKKLAPYELKKAGFVGVKKSKPIKEKFKKQEIKTSHSNMKPIRKFLQCFTVKQ